MTPFTKEQIEEKLQAAYTQVAALETMKKDLNSGNVKRFNENQLKYMAVIIGLHSDAKDSYNKD